MRLYMIRMLSNELAPDPESSSLEGDKDLPDFSHFGQFQLSHQDNLLSKVLSMIVRTVGSGLPDCKNLLRLF